MFQIKFVDKTKTHILYSITLFSEICVVYEIMWRNIIEQGRPRVTIWRMRPAWWIHKSTNTLTICNTFSFSLHQW